MRYIEDKDGKPDMTCPKCKVDLRDTGQAFMTLPPIKIFECPQCGDGYKLSPHRPSGRVRTFRDEQSK